MSFSSPTEVGAPSTPCFLRSFPAYFRHRGSNRSRARSTNMIVSLGIKGNERSAGIPLRFFLCVNRRRANDLSSMGHCFRRFSEIPKLCFYLVASPCLHSPAQLKCVKNSLVSPESTIRCFLQRQRRWSARATTRRMACKTREILRRLGLGVHPWFLVARSATGATEHAKVVFGCQTRCLVVGGA
jgi:hypothetical protein